MKPDGTMLGGVVVFLALSGASPVARADDSAPIPTQIDTSGPGIAVRQSGFDARASAYVQAQYENHQQSENQLSSDGARLLNQDRFLIRRSRLGLSVSRPYAELLLELDANTTQGTEFSLRQAEATLRDPTANVVPLVSLTVGMFRTPFGAETQQSARDRFWAENSLAAQAFYPGESDLGVRVRGGVAWFRYALAVVNGHPIDEPTYGSRAPTRPGDFVGRLGIDTTWGSVRVTGGVSALAGTGFHPGTPATKDSIVVRDLTETGTLTPQSLQLVPGRASTPSQDFAHWAAGADLSISGRLSPALQCWLSGELYVGQNIDRALYVADPVTNGVDVREFGFVVGYTQLMWNRILAGIRIERYDPSADSTARQGGRVVRQAQDIVIASFLAGVQLPGTQTRLVVQYDAIRDHLAVASDGLPIDLRNNRLIARLQVAF